MKKEKFAFFENCIMEDKPKIVIADSQFLVIESLEHLIEEENKYVLCGNADSRYSLLKLLQQNSPDLLITDINLIDYESPNDLKSIMENFKNLSILIGGSVKDRIGYAMIDNAEKKGY